jgi:hypothetical protein
MILIMASIVLLGPDAVLLLALSNVLRVRGFGVSIACDEDQARRALSERPSLVIWDRQIKEVVPDPSILGFDGPAIVLANPPQLSSVSTPTRRVFRKPFGVEQLIQAAIELTALGDVACQEPPFGPNGPMSGLGS